MRLQLRTPRLPREKREIQSNKHWHLVLPDIAPTLSQMTILLWLETWMNLYGQWHGGHQIWCFALKCHLDVWLYWQNRQEFWSWDELDLWTNRDPCYAVILKSDMLWSQWLQTTENSVFCNIADGCIRAATGYWTASRGERRWCGW